MDKGKRILKPGDRSRSSSPEKKSPRDDGYTAGEGTPDSSPKRGKPFNILTDLPDPVHQQLTWDSLESSQEKQRKLEADQLKYDAEETEKARLASLETYTDEYKHNYMWTKKVQERLKGAGTSHEQQAKSDSEPEDYGYSDGEVSQPGSDED